MNGNTFHPEISFTESANSLRVIRVALAWSGFGTRAFQFSASDGQDNPLHHNPGPDGFNSQGPRRNRNVVSTVLVLGIIISIIVGFFGLALHRAQNLTDPTDEWTSITVGKTMVTCQELIDRAMQASGDSCDRLGSNQVCYGNNTLLAELIAGTASRFSQRGDMVSVAALRRLAASPLSLASEEWGIAVFKVMANLPRSLPGETITMVVFGNTTLDNPNNNLQTFYFSSSLGQIVCDQVPFDGLMITMPDGTGVSFVINGVEMTLMGNASITATQNGSMEVSMFSGSASVAVNGHYQIVTAGQSTRMDMGGPDGMTAISHPSPPQPLSPEALTLACTMTDRFCSPQEITPVSPLDAIATLAANPGLLPTSAATATPLLTLAPTLMATLVRSRTPTPEPPTATPKPVYVTLCHYVSANNYNEITVEVDPVTGTTGHYNHPGDIIPAPGGGCPLPPEPTPEPTQEPPPKPTKKP